MVSLSRANANAVTACQTPTVVKELKRKRRLSREYWSRHGVRTAGPDGWRAGQRGTRRGFAGFASCALCAVTGFIATDASAQGAPPVPTTGYTRKILSQVDGPTPGYVTIAVEAELQPGGTVARHTHPGIESTYVLEGSFELPIQGQPTRSYKQGDNYQIPAGTPHAGGKPSDTKVRLATTYVVEKDKPLVSPA